MFKNRDTDKPIIVQVCDECHHIYEAGTGQTIILEEVILSWSSARAGNMKELHYCDSHKKNYDLALLKHGQFTFWKQNDRYRQVDEEGKDIVPAKPKK